MDEDWPHPELDVLTVFRVLDQHRIDYVLIGGLALALHGSNQLTFDVALVPAAERANLDRPGPERAPSGDAQRRVRDRDDGEIINPGEVCWVTGVDR